jgi:tetratricopeptide (TPR) repeat protein
MHVLYRHLSGDTEDIREGSSAADLLYAKGDYRGAFQAYEKTIAKAPGDLEAWAGMTLSAAADGITLDALTAMPEMAAEIYQQAASMDPGLKRPLSLAQWLDRAG